MNQLTNAKERFMKAIQKDPYLVGLILSLKLDGLYEFTNYGTVIVHYHNRKLGTTAIIDPTKPTIFIKENEEDPGFHIPIKTAIRLTTETFGTPEVMEVPKFHTNIPIYGYENEP
jgi:hypothetical protein